MLLYAASVLYNSSVAPRTFAAFTLYSGKILYRAEPISYSVLRKEHTNVTATFVVLDTLCCCREIASQGKSGAVYASSGISRKYSSPCGFRTLLGCCGVEQLSNLFVGAV